ERDLVTTYTVEKASPNGRERVCHDVFCDESISQWLREILSRRIPWKKPLQMVERDLVTTYTVEKASPNGRERVCHDVFCDESISQWLREILLRRIRWEKLLQMVEREYVKSNSLMKVCLT